MANFYLLGAAIGDIAGSIYEFDGKRKPTKENVELIPNDSFFTDDTVMTAAICDALKNGETENSILYLKKWAQKYPNAGYGNAFLMWVLYGIKPPFDSYGNGAAMRVSPVAYFAEDIEDCKRLSKAMTECSHGHEEGIKGAETIALLVFMALHGYTKEEMHEYAISQYDFESLDYEEMRSYYGHGEEICQITVPQALWCFFHSESFEDCLRTSLSVGWDADTLAATACSIAEAYYGIPKSLKKKAIKKLPKDILEALKIIPR